MNMSTESTETAIVEKLKRDIPGTDSDVQGYPDDARSFFPKHPVGSVLVQYAGSKFTEPRAFNSITQTRTPEFKVFVLRRDLRGHAGVQGSLDAVRASLTGFAPPGYSKMYPVSERFLAEQNGVWIYEMKFAFEGRYQESAG